MRSFIYPFVLSLFLVIGFQFDIRASHVGGAEISYACTSTPGVFEVTLVYYRTCTGVEMCPNGCGEACNMVISIRGVDSIYTTSNFGTATLTLQNVRDVDTEARSHCENAKNTCINTGCSVPGLYTPGYERYEFKGLVNIGSTSGIPAACCNVRFTWEQCCRSENILTGSANENFYVDAIVNRCHSISPCNSSPIFTSDPQVVMCGGESFVYNLGASDPDFDSLTYAFAPALQAYNTSVTYSVPFSYSRPMPWTGNATSSFPSGIRCDPETGDIFFTPGNSGSQSFYGVMAIEVKQWKTINGVPTVIGITRRDVEETVLGNCPSNNSPRFITNPPEGTNPNAPKTKWEICAGEQLCFTVTAKDTDFLPSIISDTTYLKWDSALAGLGATFLPVYTTTRSVSGPREDSYQFCWTPDTSLARNNPYYFSVSAKDNRCPNPGRLSRMFSVKVIEQSSLTIQKEDLRCGYWRLSYTNNKSQRVPTAVVWKVSSVEGDYSLSQSPTTATTSFVDVKFKDAGKYLVSLQANTTGPNGVSCMSFFYDTIVVDAQLNVNVPDTFACNGSATQLSATGKHGASAYTYRWFHSINDTATTPLNDTTLSGGVFTTPPLTSSQTYTVRVRDAAGCIAYDSANVLIRLQVKNITANPASCYGLSDGSVNIQMTDTLYPYQYKMDQGSFQLSSVFSGLDQDIYSITIKDTNTCSSTVIATISQPLPLHDTITTIVRETCFDTHNAVFSTTAKGGTAPYQYSMDSINFTSTGMFNQLAAGNHTIHIKDAHGCYASVTRTINPTDSLSIVPVVSASCMNAASGSILFKVTGGTQPYTFKVGNGLLQGDSLFTHLPAATYAYAIGDAKTCLKSDSITITSLPALHTKVSTQNVSCFGRNDGQVEIQASGGTGSLVYRVNGGMFSASHLFANLVAGTYRITVKDSAGCEDTSQVAEIIQPAKIIASAISGTGVWVLLGDTETYTVNPQPGVSYIWSVQKGQIIGSDSSWSVKVNWNTFGVGELMVTLYFDSACSDSSGLFVNVGNLAIGEIAGTIQGVSMYPNPVTHTLNVTIDKGFEGNRVLLYDINGRLVVDQLASKQQSINMEGLAPGMYLLRVGTWQQKVIKE